MTGRGGLEPRARHPLTRDDLSSILGIVLLSVMVAESFGDTMAVTERQRRPAGIRTG